MLPSTRRNAEKAVSWTGAQASCLWGQRASRPLGLQAGCPQAPQPGRLCLSNDPTQRCRCPRMTDVRRCLALITALVWLITSFPSRAAAADEKIRLRPVESSSIAKVGYNATYRHLVVEFRSGATYRYAEVPRARARAFLKAESKGQYFVRNIRSKYAFTRMCSSPP